jgi:AcrR family transcriptional regulator
LTFLWTHPFRDLTVAELMSLAGTSRSAFYQYFEDLHGLMEALLHAMKEDIFDVATPWLQGEGDPLPLLEQSLEGLVRVCYQQGPILRAVSDAAPMDERLENAWTNFYYYPGEGVWTKPFIGGSYLFLDKNNARYLDARAFFRFYATGITPAMTQAPYGKGLIYAVA